MSGPSFPIVSHSGYAYRTRCEVIQLGPQSLQLTFLADIDKTIDDLFIVYQEQGRTELFEEMCPYFGILWPSGRVLADEFAKLFARPDENRPNWARQPDRVLELGCGLGVVAMVLARAGYKVDVIDQHPDVVRFLDVNLRTNAVSGVNFFGSDWSSAAKSGQAWPLVVASDVLYDQSQPGKLKSTLDLTVQPGGVAIIADPGRSYLERFVQSMEESGWTSNLWGEAGVSICEFTKTAD